MEMKVKVDTIDKVKQFVKTATLVSEDIDISDGKKYIDAKSIMGFFSLDLTKELHMMVNTSEDRFSEIRTLFANFTV